MKLYIAVLLASFAIIMTAQTSKDTSALKSKVDSIIASHKGTFAVAFKDLKTNATLYVNEHERFHAASTMKTPVMIEVFKQIKEKKISLQDSVVIKNSFKSIIDGSDYSLSLTDDSEDGLYDQIGKKATIYDLIYKMITVSSNLSTNILIGIVGPDNVMKTMKSLNVNDLQVLRGVEDTKAFNEGKNNTTTAFDLSILFEMIAKKQMISDESCDAMVKILLAQKFNDMIPAKLPQEVKVAHKTGSITNVQHDSGIIYLPDGRVYILVILSKDLVSNKDGIEAVATLSKVIYNFMTH
jgi:beta-lactamase class A